MNDRIPIIVGVGEVTDRPATPELGLEPATLVAEALRRADQDARGAGWLERLDSLDVVNSISWPYADLPGRVSEMIEHRPTHVVHGVVGGETPIRYIQEAAQRIARGECDVAAVSGAEASHTVQKAEKAGISLPWTARDPTWTSPRVRDYLHPVARHHGMMQPPVVYPLYENAASAFWGQTPAQARAESASLWSEFSVVAAENPYAWIKRAYSAAEIERPSTGNRLIAWPYTKLTVANPTVNQGAAILLTSVANARAAAIPEDRWIYLWSGAAAVEPRDFMSRDQFHRSPAMEAALEATLSRAEIDASQLDYVELYSCFPCVPKMAKRYLKLPTDLVPTVAGGLTFFGAPLNNYMTHATAAMVRRLRAKPGTVGLLYGQGEFVTKHHALVVASRRSSSNAGIADTSVQHIADARRGPTPEIVETAAGESTVETYTVLFGPDSKPERGIVVVRAENGARTMARVPVEDGPSMGALLDLSHSAVGRVGLLRPASDGLLEWSVS